MTTYPCPKGHASTEPDYCSDCGARIQTEPTAIAHKPGLSPTSSPSPSTQFCPDCGTPHETDSGKFCEICGYNFVTGVHGEIPLPPAPSPVQDAGAAQLQPPVAPISTVDTVKQAAISSPSGQGEWELAITISSTRHHPDSPDPPLDQPPITLQLQQENSLIGRTSEKRAIYPDIALDFDDAVSHRHALLIKQSDGRLMVRDIGSANGTKLNGTELVEMQDTAIANGDKLTLGHWTRIQFKQI